MHKNEINIDENLVSALLKDQCPQWAYLPLKPISSSGTDHALFRLGKEYIVRFPRVEWEPGSNDKNINKEYVWVNQIARFLKISISEPVFKGGPDHTYPWSWLITKWNEGHNPNFEKENEYELLAIACADFLNNLHAITLANGPFSRRGVPLKEIDVETSNAISQLKDEIDIQKVTALWARLSNAAPCNKNPVWIHGDFLPGNILVQNNRLNAVIDFSDVGIGDPACDLVIAWSLFNSHSRKIFRKKLENMDDATWERGRGWALSIALIMLPYYKNSNPMLATLARRMLKTILSDLEGNN